MINQITNPISAASPRIQTELLAIDDEKAFRQNLFDLLINKSLQGSFEENKELKLQDRKWNLQILDQRIKQLTLSNKIKRSIKIHNLISKLKSQRNLFCKITKQLSQLPQEKQCHIKRNFISEDHTSAKDKVILLDKISRIDSPESGFTKKHLQRLDIETSLYLLKMLNNKNITSLQCYPFQMQSTSQKVLPKLLESSKSLQSLSFKEIFPFDSCRFYSLARLLKNHLKQNIPLVNLSINTNIFPLGAMKDLEEGLRRNTHLKHLELLSCRERINLSEDVEQFQHVDVTPILEAMGDNTTLESLVISEAYVTNLKAITTLNEALKSTSALKNFDLTDCSLPKDSGTIIGRGLPTYKKLSRLRLARLYLHAALFNYTTNELNAIAKGLTLNKSVTHLSLDNYDFRRNYHRGFFIDDTALDNLSVMLTKNRTLKSLSMLDSLNDVSLRASDLFALSIAKNLTLEWVDCRLSANLERLGEEDLNNQLAKIAFFKGSKIFAAINRKHQFKKNIHTLLYNMNEQTTDSSNQNTTQTDFNATAFHIMPYLLNAIAEIKFNIYLRIPD